MNITKLRSVLFWILQLLMISSAAIILVRGLDGGLGGRAMPEAFKLLIQFYAPTLIIMVTFYFSFKKGAVGSLQIIPMQTSIIGIFLTSVYLSLAPISLLMSTDYQSAFDFLDTFKGFGDGIANAVIVFCFLHERRSDGA